MDKGSNQYFFDAGVIGYGYLQHAGAEWCNKYCLLYHLYLIPKEIELEDNYVFAYGNGLNIVAKADKDIEGEKCTVIVERN